MNKDRKIALASLGVAIVGIVLYRRHQQTTGSTSTTIQAQSTGAIQPYTPQQPLILQPNESVYDPNSEGLLTAPTQGNSAGSPNYQVNIRYPKSTRVKSNRKRPTVRKQHKNPHHNRAVKTTHHKKVTKVTGP